MSPDRIDPAVGIPVALVLTVVWLVVELRATRRTR